MKAKNIARIIIATFFIVFLVVYLGMATGYLEVENSKKTILTNEAIKRYEEDLKKGKRIDLENYLEEEKVYSNRISNMALGASSIIEKGFNAILNYLFSEMNKAVNENK